MKSNRSPAFSLVELLVVVAVISVIASLLLPALARAKGSARKSACASNLRQLGLIWRIYLDDHESRFPDRRDLKESLPGGYKPWDSWPMSDPRAGWVAIVLRPILLDPRVLACPAVQVGPLKQVAQATQFGGFDTNSAPPVNYWMWRFDRAFEPIPSDNFWGKSELQSIADLCAAKNPIAGQPNGPGDVELVVDPYFPNTIPNLPEGIRGWSAHLGGRNRLFLDGHLEHFKDRRTR